MPNLNYSALARFSNDYTDVFNEALRQNGGNPLTSDEKRRLMDEWNKVQKQSNSGSSSSSTSGTGTVSTGSAIKDVGTASLNAVMGLLKTQESQSNTYLPNLQDQLVGIDDLMEKIKTGTFTLQGMGKTLVEMVAKGMESYYARQTKLLEEVNSKALLTGDLSRDFRETITDANPRLVQLGISFAEVADAAISIVNESGRFALVNQQTLEKAGEVGKAYLGSMQDMVSLYDDFEKIGIGAQEANSAIERAGKRSMELGLQSKKVIGDLAQNMDKINSYGFKNGIDGLATMARKATEFRMSMNEVFQIADKVMNPEGALELSANLQVLGGAIGDFNDPLKLMYMSTNNVEGLQDALIGAAKGLATYNSEQGRFEITGVNLRRAKEMAAQMGISYKELAQGALAAAEKSSAASDLLARGLTLDPDQTEFLTNIARMKDGKMTIDLGKSPDLQKYFGKQEVALDELTDQQAKELLQYQDQLKEKTTEDIARGQASNIENIKRDVNYIALLGMNQAGKKGTQLAETLGFGPTAQAKLAQSTKTESVAGGKLVTDFVDKMGNSVDNQLKEGQKIIRDGLKAQNMNKENKEASNTKTTATTSNNAPQTNNNIVFDYDKFGNIIKRIKIEPTVVSPTKNSYLVVDE
jgi:hypothetical protein